MCSKRELVRQSLSWHSLARPYPLQAALERLASGLQRRFCRMPYPYEHHSAAPQIDKATITAQFVMPKKVG